MHSITVGSVEVSFESALISIPQDGFDHDWLCDVWVDARQPINVMQADGWVTVIGLTGMATEKCPHVVCHLHPPAYTEEDVIEYFVSLAAAANTPREAANNAVVIVSYPWGKLISLNWSALGYAPGGSEYCMLPTDSCAISLGHLRLDWATVQVHAKVSQVR
jgi:hypothetical protein